MRFEALQDFWISFNPSGYIHYTMPKKKKTSYGTYLAIIPAALLVAFIIFLVVTPPSPNLTTITTNTGGQTLSQGGTAPPFTLNKIDGNGLKNEKYEFNPVSGRVVFMEFIFEWCPHCRNMAPVIEKLHRNYGEKVTFITVAGGYNTDPQKTAQFISRYGLSWTTLYDPQLEVFNKYGVRGTPTYFIIGPNGQVLAKIIAEQPYEVLAQELDQALK
jgi:thiol-disulfide isomerase/thioredoxin